MNEHLEGLHRSLSCSRAHTSTVRAISKIQAKPRNNPALKPPNSFPEPQIRITAKTRGKSHSEEGLKRAKRSPGAEQRHKNQPRTKFRCCFPLSSDTFPWKVSPVFLCQGTTEKVSMPSSSLLPATSRTATWPIITTSWKTSSCECLESSGRDRSMRETIQQLPCVHGTRNPSWEWSGSKAGSASVQLQTGASVAGGTPAPAPSPTSTTIQTFQLIMPGMGSHPGWSVAGTLPSWEVLLLGREWSWGVHQSW